LQVYLYCAINVMVHQMLYDAILFWNDREWPSLHVNGNGKGKKN
jgi:hypothetical protein